jgi:L-serine dehydratase
MISVFDLFKVGIGPSSSHTMGPMRAAAAFVNALAAEGRLTEVAEVIVELFGSLALTGKGHGIDRAILLGLEGERADTVDIGGIDARLATIRKTHTLSLAGLHPIAFDELKHLRFYRNETLPEHPNGMRFTARSGSGATVLRNEYFSIGGGFIVGPGAPAGGALPEAVVPYDFHSSSELLAFCDTTGKSIAEIVRANEAAIDPSRDVRAGLLRLWRVMQECAGRGLKTTGELPGGLHVRRRAPALANRLRHVAGGDPLRVLDMVSVWAMAVNEENAGGGRVVTAPTNGAAGLIPAVLHYYMEYIPRADEDGVATFLLTAAAIGMLCKENASISGAEIGCQGEVGVACAMAAAGLVSGLGGTPRQIEHAAEIGIEHHLGMTCDPVNGLVQIPCIERNAVGAVKAIHASRLAMNSEGEHRVSLDQAIETMRQTGRDMQSSYKETSLAGLAVNVINC